MQVIFSMTGYQACKIARLLGLQHCKGVRVPRLQICEDCKSVRFWLVSLLDVAKLQGC